MKLLTGILLFCFCSSAMAFRAGVSVEQQKKEAIQRLEKRKQGFDQFMARKEAQNKKRLATAYKMKKIRKVEADKKEKARMNFRRTTYEFPIKAYRKFIKNRDRKRVVRKKAHADYTKLKKQLRSIDKNPKYKIDGNKEFDL